MNGNPLALPPIEADQPCFKCHRTGPHVVDRFAQLPSRWDDPERFMHASGLCPEPPSGPAPTAADLPADSVVAFFGDDPTDGSYRKPRQRWDVAIKRARNERPWQTTHGLGGAMSNDFEDDDIDEMLAEGRAQVLRVGNGAS